MDEKEPLDFVIAGGGTAGWIAAATLARFSPPGTRIQLIESDALGTVGVGEATIPQIHLLNRALGINEAEFLFETKGTFKLGIAFDGWREEGHSYMHAFGQIGRAAGLLPFHHYWLRGQKLGIAHDLSRYSLNELAGRAGKMQRGQRTPDFPEMPYAYHFDAGLYAGFLRRYAEGLGVTRHEGLIASIERNADSGDISALLLEDGRRIDGGFFIDCTGFRRLLIGGALDVPYTDWSHLLPCDRAAAVPCSTAGDFTPYTRSIAREAGWQWRIPLQHRIGNGYVFSSANLSEEKACETLLANLDGRPQGDPRILKFTTGTSARHWERNCLAVGLAAGFMEPLESTSIHLIQSAISRFLTVLPSGSGDPAIIDWFNAQAEFEWSRIRDFLILHYVANGREGQPFWDDIRNLELPDTLEAKLDQWRSAGHIHREHEELFTEVGWFQVLVGQGVEAMGYNPGADAISEADLQVMLDQVESGFAAEVQQMPEHAPFLKAFMMQHIQPGVSA
ncbi:tryptophan halogenase family protein [Erythrobacter sp. HA6-11]